MTIYPEIEFFNTTIDYAFIIHGSASGAAGQYDIYHTMYNDDIYFSFNYSAICVSTGTANGRNMEYKDSQIKNNLLLI